MVKKYFKENLKRLLMPGGILFVLALLCVAVKMPRYLQMPIIAQSVPLFLVMCFISPLAIVLVNFRFLKHRSDNDFYNSLPLSRLQLFASNAIACLLISLLSIGLPLTVIVIKDGFSLFSVQCFSAVVLSWGASVMAVTLSNGSAWSVIIASELVFLPCIIYSFIADIFIERLPSVSNSQVLFDRLLLSRYNPFVSCYIPQQRPCISAVVYGIGLGVLFIVMSAVIYKRNTKFSVTACMLPVTLLFIPAYYYGQMIGNLALILFMLTVAMVFITTVYIKFKALTKIIKSFIVLVTVAVVFIAVGVMAKIYGTYCLNTDVTADKAYIEVSPYNQLNLNRSYKNAITDTELLDELETNIDTEGNTVVKFCSGGIPVYKKVSMNGELSKKIFIEITKNSSFPDNYKLVSISASWAFDKSNIDFKNEFFDFYNALSFSDKADLFYGGIEKTRCALGDNGFEATIGFGESYNFYLNAADFPEFFDRANDLSTPEVVITDYASNLENNTDMDRYLFEGVRLKPTISDEAADIFRKALTRSFEDVYNELGKEEFLKGGVFCLEDGKYGYGKYLIYLTADEYQTVKQGI